jgi:hypothetical protein
MQPASIEIFQNIETLFFKHFDALEKVITKMEGASMPLAQKGLRLRFIDRASSPSKFIAHLKALAKEYDYVHLLDAIRQKIAKGEVIFEEYVEVDGRKFWRGYVISAMKEKALHIQVKKTNGHDSKVELTPRYSDVVVVPLEKFTQIATHFAKVYHIEKIVPKVAIDSKKIESAPLPVLVHHKAKTHNPRAEAILQEIEAAAKKQHMLEEKRQKAA